MHRLQKALTLQNWPKSEVIKPEDIYHHTLILYKSP